MEGREVTDANKAYILREFEREASGLRRAAEAVHAAGAPPIGQWGPREVLAHITLWAVQATQHFRLGLPPLDYGDPGRWGPELFGTFDAAFARLVGPDQSREEAREVGWRAVAAAGVSLPLSVPETAELHMKVDEAFNDGAVALVRDQSFDRVLQITEGAHADFRRLLEERPADGYAPDGHLYRRMVLVIQHHVDHRTELEAHLANVAAPSV
jgi:hypothetical protein